MTKIIDAATMINDSYHAYNDANGDAQLDTTARPIGGGWLLFKVIDHTVQGGDYSVVFKNDSTQEIFIAGRGTAQIGDALPDAGIVLGLPPNARIDDAASTLDDYRNNYSDYNISAGGHSLGGEVWAKVSERDGNLDVLAINAPNSAIDPDKDFYGDSHVIDITARYDAVGHFGPDYSNSIELDTQVSGGIFNQFGSEGTHSIVNTILNGIARNSYLADQDLGSVDPIAVVGGGVSSISWAGQQTGGTANDTTSTTLNSDDSVSVTTTGQDGSTWTSTTNTDGTISGERHETNGSYSMYANDGQGDVQTDNYVADGTKTGDSWQHSDGSSGTDTFNPDGSGSRYFLAADGSYAEQENGADGSWSYDFQYNDGSYGWAHYGADGVGSDYQYAADGSYSQSERNADGSFHSSYHNSDGSYGSQNDNTDGTGDKYNQDASGYSEYSYTGRSAGSGESEGGYLTFNSDYHYADGSYGDYAKGGDGSTSTHTHNADGSYSESQTSADGSSHSENRYADGSYDSQTYGADGSVHIAYANADGSHGYQDYIADGSYDSASYSSDGSYQTDQHNTDGSYTDTIGGADGSSGWTAHAVDGSVRGYVEEADGSYSESQMSADGTYSEDYHNADGSHGSSQHNADGSNSSASYGADGSYDLQSYGSDGSYTDTFGAADGTHGSLSRSDGVYSYSFNSGDGNWSVEGACDVPGHTLTTSFANGDGSSGTETKTPYGPDNWSYQSPDGTTTFTQNDTSAQWTWQDIYGTGWSGSFYDSEQGVWVQESGGTGQPLDIGTGEGMSNQHWDTLFPDFESFRNDASAHLTASAT